MLTQISSPPEAVGSGGFYLPADLFLIHESCGDPPAEHGGRASGTVEAGYAAVSTPLKLNFFRVFIIIYSN